MSNRYKSARIIPDDDFAHAKKIQELGERTGGIPPQPSKTLPFVGSAVRNVGFSQLLTPNQKARAIAMNAPDEESSVVSLMLDAFGAQAFAYINVGAGGVFSEIEVDIARGVSFDLVGSMIEVDMINDSTAGSNALCKAFAGWMPSGAHPSSRPTRTFKRTVGYIQSGYQQPVTAGQSLDAVGAAVTRLIVPPNFAKDVLIQRNPSSAPFTVTMRDETGAVILNEVLIGAGAEQVTPIELTNDCKLIGVQNNSAGACSFRAIFGLGI